MQTAERNRKIKKVLSEAFGTGKVTVRGSRGTAYGWVSISIDYRPKDRERRDALKAKVWALFDAAGIAIGTYGYDDPGSDYGYGRKMILEFGACRDTFRAGERVEWNCRQGTVKGQDYAKGGDWHQVQMDDAEPGKIEEFYKNDLTSMEPAQC